MRIGTALYSTGFGLTVFLSSMQIAAQDDAEYQALDPTIPIHPIGFYNGSPGAWFTYGDLLCISVNNGKHKKGSRTFIISKDTEIKWRIMNGEL